MTKLVEETLMERAEIERLLSENPSFVNFPELQEHSFWLKAPQLGESELGEVYGYWRLVNQRNRRPVLQHRMGILVSPAGAVCAFIRPFPAPRGLVGCLQRASYSLGSWIGLWSISRTLTQIVRTIDATDPSLLGGELYLLVFEVAVLSGNRTEPECSVVIRKVNGPELRRWVAEDLAVRSATSEDSAWGP